MKAMKVMKKKAAMKAMKAMKVMKKKAAMKAMKAMKKKSVSKIAKGSHAKSMVLRGSKEKTVGGLTAKDLCKNKYGKIVSKKASAFAKKSPWIQAVTKARKALKITGFSAIKSLGAQRRPSRLPWQLLPLTSSRCRLRPEYSRRL